MFFDPPRWLSWSDSNCFFSNPFDLFSHRPLKSLLHSLPRVSLQKPDTTKTSETRQWPGIIAIPAFSYHSHHHHLQHYSTHTQPTAAAGVTKTISFITFQVHTFTDHQTEMLLSWRQKLDWYWKIKNILQCFDIWEGVGLVQSKEDNHELTKCLIVH